MKNAPSFFDETADDLMESGLTNNEIAERSAGDNRDPFAMRRALLKALESAYGTFKYIIRAK